MTLRVYDDDGSIRVHKIEKNYKFIDNQEIKFIEANTKESNLLQLIKAFYSNQKVILFDKSNKSIYKKLHNLDLSTFQNYPFCCVFFTSGTTGSPIGALKTKDNLLNEIKELTKLLEQYQIKRVIVTVPFIHFYGTLLGALFALENNIDIVIKEHFLPHDLLDICEDNSMVVTTPLYIKSLNRLGIQKNLSNSIFISSTAPLFPDIAKKFNQNFNTNIIQLFGSTETGGIAYKYNDEAFWTPIDSVEVSQNEQGELKVTSPFVSNTLFENSFKTTNGSIQTFDYIEKNGEKFKLIGRSSQIIKVAGKRYSTIQIENILENEIDIEKAVVFVTTNKNALRGEELNITLQSKKDFIARDIKKILKQQLENIRFSIKLKIVDEIKTTSVGKKMLIQ